MLLFRALRRARAPPAARNVYDAAAYGGAEGPPPPTDQARFTSIVSQEKERDVETLVSTYTAPALALALRDRESTLQLCARLFDAGRMEELEAVLLPFARAQLLPVAQDPRPVLPDAITPRFLTSVSKCLARIPRQVSRLAGLRASIVIPLCHNEDGVPSVLLTQRSSGVSRYKRQICFPGGMVDTGDRSIVDAGLREMAEEVGIQRQDVEVLGVLRCDWSEVTAITGVACSPVVGFVGDVRELDIAPNADEVEDWFALPLERLLDPAQWERETLGDLVFTGVGDLCKSDAGQGPPAVWGLTAYILNEFVRNTLRPPSSSSSQY